MDEYFTDRAFVELTEILKEKERGRLAYIPRLEKEYESLRSKWDEFIKKWETILMLPGRSKKLAEELNMLEELSQELSSRIQEALEAGKVDAYAGVCKQLGALVNQLLQAIHDGFKQNLTVGPCMIAEVASPMTCVPASFLLRAYEVPLEGLGSRLSESLIGQEHVIRAIISALSKRKFGPRPIGSFLFLGPPGCGRTELSRALAQQLFGQKDMLIKFDMAEFSDSDSVSRLIGVCSSDNVYGSGGQLTENVRRNPFSVIMFNNVEKAHDSVVDVLAEILGHGRLRDGEGSVVDFTTTVIVMTSSAGEDKFRPVKPCEWCVKMVGPLTSTEILKTSEGKKAHRCYYIPLLKEAEGHFKPGFFEKFDDVIVLGRLSSSQYIAVTRLLLRNIASSMSKKGVIIYPSEAALGRIVGLDELFIRGGHVIRVWLETNLIPLLSDMIAKNEIDEMSIIYIDTLVGMDDWCYRVEKSGLVEDQTYNCFKQALMKSRILYQKEKHRVNNIYRLRRQYFNLSTLLNVEDELDVVHIFESIFSLVDIVRELIEDSQNVNKLMAEPGGADYNKASRCRPSSVAIEMTAGSSDYLTSVHMNFLKEKVELRQGDWTQKSAKHGIEGLCSNLRGMPARYPLIDFVAKSLLLHRPPMSFLFLGLTCVGKVDLVKGLAEHLVAENGTNLLIEVDLSKYTDPDLLFRPAGIGQAGLLLGEAVMTSPHSVIVFHQIERAHISVFSALLSVLEHGVLFDSHGRTLDFSKAVVIFISDLGNKKFIYKIVGGASQDSVEDEEFEQEGARTAFRTELLNKVDDIVFFDPFAHEQLRNVARLSMRAGPHFERGHLELTMSLFILFGTSGRGKMLSTLLMDDAVKHLLKGIVRGETSQSESQLP